jgi:hypothetical protein
MKLTPRIETIVELRTMICYIDNFISYAYVSHHCLENHLEDFRKQALSPELFKEEDKNFFKLLDDARKQRDQYQAMLDRMKIKYPSSFVK